MKDIIDMFKKDKKMLIFVVVIVVVLLLMLILPKLSGGEQTTPAVNQGEINNKMTQEQYLEIKANSTLLFPKTNESFRYNVYDNYVEITECISEAESVTVPSVLEDLPVLSVRIKTFAASKTKTVIFEEGVVYLDSEAFANNKYIETVKLPNSLLRIGDRAFAECVNLQSVDLGKSVENIGAMAFINCAMLKEIVLPNTTKEIGEDIFAGCSSLLEIFIPKSISIIPPSAFAGCELLTSVMMEEGEIDAEDFVPRTIEGYAFSDCPSLISVYIPKDFGTIDNSAFSGHSSSLMIYGYTSSPSALFAAQNLINFSVIDIENFKSVSEMFNNIRKEINTITSKYIDDENIISVENAPMCISELSEYAKSLKDNNKNISGYGLKDDYFVIAFINGQKIELKLNIDEMYYTNLEEETDA